MNSALEWNKYFRICIIKFPQKQVIAFNQKSSIIRVLFIEYWELFNVDEQIIYSYDRQIFTFTSSESFISKTYTFSSGLDVMTKHFNLLYTLNLTISNSPWFFFFFTSFFTLALATGSRTITSDRAVYNNSSLSFWTRLYDVTR